eukprot:m.8136 g.8136  ORF g.8136 m.8136 type:complete len:208 (+) comp5322_c0_seq2:138-761(+)
MPSQVKHKHPSRCTRSDRDEGCQGLARDSSHSDMNPFMRITRSMDASHTLKQSMHQGQHAALPMRPQARTAKSPINRGTHAHNHRQAKSRPAKVHTASGNGKRNGKRNGKGSGMVASKPKPVTALKKNETGCHVPFAATTESKLKFVKGCDNDDMFLCPICRDLIVYSVVVSSALSCFSCFAFQFVRRWWIVVLRELYRVCVSCTDT